MPCMGGGSVTICTTSHQLLDAEPGPVLWCFTCREHRVHFVCYEHQNSPWYDDELRIRCDRCGDLARDFQGNCIDQGSWPQEARDAAAVMEARAESMPAPELSYMQDHMSEEEWSRFNREDA